MNQTSSAHPAGRAPHHPRPEPGTPVIIGWRKWDGSPHWRHEAHYLGEDRWGSWVGQLPGQRSHRPGRDFLAEGLRAAGASVEFVTAYRRCVPALTPALRATLENLLQHNNDWIITSSEALRGLLALLAALDDSGSENGVVVKMQQQHLIVPHARIAQTATALGFARVTLTGSGDAGVLAALQSRP